jgi:predicted transcriptional regulator of viral defense system
LYFYPIANSVKTSYAERILRQARRKGIVSPGDFAGVPNPTVYLKRLVHRGDLVRLSRGVYGRPDMEYSQYHSLAEAAKRLPSGVICLLSALSFHEFTTQIPPDIWMAFCSNFTPAGGEVPIRAVRMSGYAFSHGIEKHVIEGVQVRVYSPAKTVADCFKYRNKVGLDVAMEALREGWREKKFTMEELATAAAACRMQNVIRPYAEMLVS